MSIFKIGTIASVLLALPAAAISIVISSPWEQGFDLVAMLSHAGFWTFYLRGVFAFAVFGILVSAAIQKLSKTKSIAT